MVSSRSHVGADSPWLQKVLGTSAYLRIGSIYTYAVWCDIKTFGAVSRVSLDSVERIHWNEEKDAPQEKINTEMVFTDLESPP